MSYRVDRVTDLLDQTLSVLIAQGAVELQYISIMVEQTTFFIQSDWRLLNHGLVFLLLSYGWCGFNQSVRLDLLRCLPLGFRFLCDFIRLVYFPFTS